MLKADGLRLFPGEPLSALKRGAAKLLRIKEEEILSLKVLRRSLDARERPVFLYRVALEVRDEAWTREKVPCFYTAWRWKSGMRRRRYGAADAKSATMSRNRPIDCRSVSPNRNPFR